MRVNNGELSDEIWQLSNAVDAFVQRDPEEGGKPSQRTEFRVAYDSTTLYVKVRAFDRRGVAHTRLPHAPRRRFAVGLDSRAHRLLPRSAHRVRVRPSTPSGVKADRYWYNDNSRDDSWDAVVGCEGLEPMNRVDRRNSGFRFRSSASIRPRRARSASRCRGRSRG
jgi:hypothetical protein